MTNGGKVDSGEKLTDKCIHLFFGKTCVYRNILLLADLHVNAYELIVILKQLSDGGRCFKILVYWLSDVNSKCERLRMCSVAELDFAAPRPCLTYRKK